MNTQSNRDRARFILERVWGQGNTISYANAGWLTERRVERETLLQTCVRLAEVGPLSGASFDYVGIQAALRSSKESEL